MTACMMPSEYGADTLLGSSPALSSAFLGNSPGLGSGFMSSSPGVGSSGSSFFTDYPRCSLQVMEKRSNVSLNLMTNNTSLFPEVDTKRSYSRTGSFRRSKKLEKYRSYPVDKELPLLFSNPSKSILRITTGEEFQEELQFNEDPLQSPTKDPLLSPTKDKKKVCFADALGRQLAQIKLITERPDVPPGWSSAFQDKLIGVVEETPISNWKVAFNQPAANYLKFKEKLERECVALENAFIDPVKSVLKGIVKVHNLSFHKEVAVLHSQDGWESSTEEEGTYITTRSSLSSSSYDLYDRFSFEIPLPTCALADKIHFCIRYRCEGVEYWDNNYSRNYKLSLVLSSDKKQKNCNDPYRMQLDNWSNFASWHDLDQSTPYY